MALIFKAYKPGFTPPPQRAGISNQMAKDIASETLIQLGGNKFIVMTGAKHFLCDQYTMSFKIGRNAMGVNGVRITLNSLDTYDMQFISIRAGVAKVKSEANGVYNDMLSDVFTTHTGLYTSI